MASFTSAVSAITFAVQVQRRLHQRNKDAETPFHDQHRNQRREPVTDDNDDLFGAAVQLAARLCSAASDGDIVVSVAVRELCVGKSFRFDDRGELSLKGMPEPTRVDACGLERLTWPPTSQRTLRDRDRQTSEPRLAWPK